MVWNDLKNKFISEFNQVTKWINDEYSKIRCGRVNINIFNDLKVEAYGEHMPINQVGNIQVLDARTVVIKPYDKSTMKELLKTLNAANLGGNVQDDTDKAKITFPPVTEENRREYSKKAKVILEQAKTRVRQIRENVKSMWKNDKTVTDDMSKHFENELNNITKNSNSELENIYAKKDKELMTI